MVMVGVALEKHLNGLKKIKIKQKKPINLIEDGRLQMNFLFIIK